MKKVITEKELRNIVSETITNVLNEGWFDKMRAFTPKNTEYDPNASIETVAEQNGWEVNTFAPRTTDTHFEFVQKTSGFGEVKQNVLSPKELLDDIKLHLGNRGQIINAKAGRISDSPYDVAKTLSFDIKYN